MESYRSIIIKKLSYRRDSARCGTVKRLFMVTEGHPLLCQLTRHKVYNFLLALNSQ